MIVTGVYSSGAHLDVRAVTRKILTFTPFVSMLVALALMPFTYPEWLSTLLQRLGSTLVPLALVSVGYQLRLSQIRGRLPSLGIGLAFKLAIGRATLEPPPRSYSAQCPLILGIDQRETFLACEYITDTLREKINNEFA